METANLNQKTGAPRAAALQQWQDAKFGMFIHWGLYSIPAGVWHGEAYREAPGEDNATGYAAHIGLRLQIPMTAYAKLTDQFNPKRFDADEWVLLAKQAGMRHIVITAKHQDGFSMYGSEVCDFNIVDATPFGRDPMVDLAEAARRHGLGFGFYYSQARDHHHPLANWNAYGNTWDFPPASRDDFIQYLNDKVKPQLRELLTAYGELTCLWFDVPYDIPPEQCREIVEMVRNYQPHCLVNSRIGGDVWDFRSLADNDISDAPLHEPWETNMTMNGSWSVHQLDHNWKSTEQLIRNLVDIASKGGCLLLNVGPTADGLVPEPSVTRLQQMGAWLDVNGESIYGTSPTPIGQPDWGRCTVKGHHLFLHVFDWPTDGKLSVPGPGRTFTKACLLADTMQKGLKVDLNGEDVVISLPPEAPDPICTVVVLEQ